MSKFGHSQEKFLPALRLRLPALAVRPLGAVVLAGTLAACSLPDAPFSRDPGFAIPARWAAWSQAEPRMVDEGWVASFNSAVLNHLVQAALAHNRDLHAAEARLTQARALSRQAGAQFWPSLTVDASAGRQGVRDAGADNSYEAGLRVGWEIDLWGRIRGDRAAAALDAVAEAAIFEATRQSIAAAVADTWIVLNGNIELRNIARNELSARRASLASVEERVAAQALLAVDANWARAEVARAQERLVAAEGAIQQSTRALEVLIGRYPSGTLNAATGLPRLPGTVPVGLPAQLLERRPDVIAAERRVAAAYFRAREAQAARLPRLTLSADVTREWEPSRVVWELVGGLIAPIFDGGRLAEGVVIANARQQEALANYSATALEAFREVETAMANEQILRRRLGFLNNAADELLRATNLERERFEAAEIDLQRLDDVRLRYYSALRDRTAVQVELLRNRVALHLALGGSFGRVVPHAYVAAVSAKPAG